MTKVQCFYDKKFGHITYNWNEKFCNYYKQCGHIILDFPTRPRNKSTEAFHLPLVLESLVLRPWPTPKSVQQMVLFALSTYWTFMVSQKISLNLDLLIFWPSTTWLVPLNIYKIFIVTLAPKIFRCSFPTMPPPPPPVNTSGGKRKNPSTSNLEDVREKKWKATTLPQVSAWSHVDKYLAFLSMKDGDNSQICFNFTNDWRWISAIFDIFSLVSTQS